MSQQTRDERLEAELESLRALKKLSSILDFETKGDPPDRYTITFRGRGVCRDSSSHSDVEFVDLHRCEIRLGYSYPQRGPDIRWLTNIFHPNISFSGFINLKEIGLPWEQALTLDVVCERLWDIVRMAHVNEDQASNYAAKTYFQKESTLKLPLDQRPLRDHSAPTGSNVISYERRPGSGVSLPQSKNTTDVLFIGDEPPVQSAPPAPPRQKRPPLPTDQDDDILFIE